jgi:AraC-like DNA-binding protein
MPSYPRPNPLGGLAVSRTDHAFGLDLIAITLTSHEFPRHVHEGYTIAQIEHGAVELWCRGVNRRYGAGSFLLLNPGEVHTGRVARGHSLAQYRVIFPTVRLVEALLGRAPPFERIESRDPALVRTFYGLWRSAADPASFAAQSGLTDGLERLFAGFAPRPSEAAARSSAVVRRVREVLLDNLRAPPSLADLGRSVDLHPNYLIRLFRSATGLPPHSYLVQLRVMRARQLLGKGAPITVAAFEAGFADQSHLTRQFKRVMGLSPGRFRRELGYFDTGSSKVRLVPSANCGTRGR